MCVFCQPLSGREVLYEDDLVYAIPDAFPVSRGHALVITKAHRETLFDATPEERKALFDAAIRVKSILDGRHHPDGYNIGVNCGPAAGQSVMHVHVHVIPRYAGDELHPRGGVRGVIPGKKTY